MVTSRRSRGLVLPLALALIGVALILVGQLPLDPGPTASLPPITTPSPSAVGQTVTPSEQPTDSAAPSPTATPIPPDWVATQMQIASVGVNVRVERLPPGQPLGNCCAYLIASTADPGRGSNTYIAGHALLTLLKGLWNVQPGADVQLLMSDGAVLHYVVTEIHPNVSCPDENEDPMPNPPLALLHAPPGCAAGALWTAPTDHERLTLQTSQGFNRNWGELVIVALPIAP